MQILAIICLTPGRQLLPDFRTRHKTLVAGPVQVGWIFGRRARSGRIFASTSFFLRVTLPLYLCTFRCLWLFNIMLSTLPAISATLTHFSCAQSMRTVWGKSLFRVHKHYIFMIFASYFLMMWVKKYMCWELEGAERKGQTKEIWKYVVDTWIQSIWIYM